MDTGEYRRNNSLRGIGKAQGNEGIRDFFLKHLWKLVEWFLLVCRNSNNFSAAMRAVRSSKTSSLKAR